jgi:RNA polymerase sigma-70 factor (ECF subfamily)
MSSVESSAATVHAALQLRFAEKSARHCLVICSDAAHGTPDVKTPSPTAPPPVADQTRWFAEEVHVHDGQLKAYLRGSFPSVRDVDDVVQESYLRIWRIKATQPVKSAKAFLYTIAKRIAIDWVRRKTTSVINGVEELDGLGVFDDGQSAVDAVSRAEIVELMIEAVASLSPRCREIVILRKFKLLTVRETALELGLKEHTIEVQLARANARIRAYLEARGITSVLGRED